MINQNLVLTILVAHTFGTWWSTDSRLSLGTIVSRWADRPIVALESSVFMYMTLITLTWIPLGSFHWKCFSLMSLFTGIALVAWKSML